MVFKGRLSLYNLLAAVGYQIVAAIGGFIVPNLILSQYGIELHGYTSTVTNALVYVALVTAGLAPAAVQAFYKPLTENNNSNISAVYNAVSKLYERAGYLYFVIVIFVSCILVIRLNKQLEAETLILLFWVMGISGVLECFLYYKYRTLLLADQRLFVVTLIDMFGYLLRIIIQILLIIMNISIVFVMMIPASIVVIKGLILKSYIRKKYNEINKNVPPDYSGLKKRYNALVHQISSLVVLNTDVILLTFFTDLQSVSIYSVYNLVFASLYSLLVNMFKNGTVASFGRLIISNDKITIQNTYDIFEYIYFGVISVIYVVAGVMIKPFIILYTSNKSNVIYWDVYIAILFIAIGIINNMRVPADTIITAAGHFKETQKQAITEAIINLVVSIILLKPLGIVGLLIGTLCSFAYRSIDIIVYAHKKIMNKSLGLSISRALRVIFIESICVMSMIKFNILIYINTWFEWLKYAFISVLLVGVVVLCVNFICEPKIFKQCVQYIMKVIGIQDK